MKKIITLLFFCFWAALMAQVQRQYKRNSKSSDTELLPGASILIHTPGSRYSALSNGEGRFSMLNMRVGGPYKVMITLDFTQEK
jgi:hypothetical protein